MKITFWSTYRRWEDLHSQENTTLSEIRSSRCCLFFLSTVREARTHPLHLRPHPGAPGAEPEAGRGQDLRLLPAKWDLKNLQTSMTSPVITILIPSRTYVYCDCSSIPLLSFLWFCTVPLALFVSEKLFLTAELHFSRRGCFLISPWGGKSRKLKHNGSTTLVLMP